MDIIGYHWISLEILDTFLKHIQNLPKKDIQIRYPKISINIQESPRSIPDNRKRQRELELRLHELGLMEKRVDDGNCAAELLQNIRALMLCMSRRVRTAPRQTPSQS